MRKIAEALFSALWQSEDDQLPNIVKNYHDHYKRIDQLLRGVCVHARQKRKYTRASSLSITLDHSTTKK